MNAGSFNPEGRSINRCSRRHARNPTTLARPLVSSKSAIPREPAPLLSSSNRPALGIEPKTAASCVEPQVRHPFRHPCHRRSTFYGSPGCAVCSGQRTSESTRE
jgi:hypothetical protein